MNKPILIVLCISFFVVSFALIGKAQTNKVREAEKWGFHGVVEDFFSGKEDEPWGWEKDWGWGKDIEKIKRFIFAIWGKIVDTWDQIWKGLEKGEFSSVEEYSNTIDELYQSGWNYYQKGDFDKAEREWRKILSIEPGNKKAKSAIRELWK